MKAGFRCGARIARAGAGAGAVAWAWGLGWEGARRDELLGRVAVLDLVRAWDGWRDTVAEGWARLGCEGGRSVVAPVRTVALDLDLACPDVVPGPVPALALAPFPSIGAPPVCALALPGTAFPCAALTVREEGGGYLLSSRVDGGLAMPVRAAGCLAGAAEEVVRGCGGLTGRRLGEALRGSGSGSGLRSAGLRRDRERCIVMRFGVRPR